jgi:hypothetical protein
LSYAEREMEDITEDDKEQSEFDEVLNREEELIWKLRKRILLRVWQAPWMKQNL